MNDRRDPTRGDFAWLLPDPETLTYWQQIRAAVAYLVRGLPADRRVEKRARLAEGRAS